MADGTWMIHLKKQQMNAYIPFWLVIECNNCGSIYKIDADRGVTEKYVNNYFQEKPSPQGVASDAANSGTAKKNAKRTQEQISTDQLCATAAE